MSRMRKGTKGPGWEPWSNRHERQALAADQRMSIHVQDDADRDRQFEHCRAMEELEAWACYLAGGCAVCRWEESA